MAPTRCVARFATCTGIAVRPGRPSPHRATKRWLELGGDRVAHIAPNGPLCVRCHNTVTNDLNLKRRMPYVPPRRPPVVRYASLARALQGSLGRDHVVGKSRFGKGLFSRRVFKKGDFVTEYDCSSDTPTQSTHVLRIKNSDMTVDGAPLAQSLRWNARSHQYGPLDAADTGRGYAALVNSSVGYRGRPNCGIVWTMDDVGRRPDGYVPATQARLPGEDVLPLRPFLVATRTVLTGEEFKLKYKVVHA